jgi:hypothetical protein
MPGWLLPAGVSLVLLLGLLAWVFRRRQQDEWQEDDDDDYPEDDDFPEDDIELEPEAGFSSQDEDDDQP